MKSFCFTGKPLAVHTPTEKITTCEILPQGKFVVLALDNRPNLVTLKLHNNTIATTADEDATNSAEAENICYGNKENEAKSFHL